jgi:hypothetical protein
VSLQDAPVPDLIRRKRATDATLAKYRAAAFDWKKGVTCVHMARFHLVKMGHRIEPLPRIRGPVAARRIMGERGWPDVAAMLDAQGSLERIAPAFMRLGDLAVLPDDEGFQGIVIHTGLHKLLGWHQDWPHGMIEMEASLDALQGAWRA